MPARSKSRPTSHRETPSPPRPSPSRAPAPKHPPGEGLDRSTEGLIEATRTRMKPAPIDAPPDRRTAEAKRRG